MKRRTILSSGLAPLGAINHAIDRAIEAVITEHADLFEVTQIRAMFIAFGTITSRDLAAHAAPRARGRAAAIALDARRRPAGPAPAITWWTQLCQHQAALLLAPRVQDAWANLRGSYGRAAVAGSLDALLARVTMTELEGAIRKDVLQATRAVFAR